MTSKLAVAVMAQDRPIEVDDDDMVSIPDVCGRAWWGFIHRWAETIRDDGCSSCGEYAVQFVSALHDLVNIKLIGDGDTTKTVHDPENFVKVARHYHNAVHAAGLECTICDPVGILAPVAQELPHSHVAETEGERSQVKFQPSLFDPESNPQIAVVPATPGDNQKPPWAVRFDNEIKAIRSGLKKLDPGFSVRRGRGTAPKTTTDIATMAQDPKIRISGTCEHDGPCKIKVRAVDEAVETVESADLVGDAVEEAHRQLMARRADNVTDRTFAIGANSVTRYQFQFRVVEAGELAVSNDPFTFVPNPEYPEELQPRDRARTAVRLQVEKLAANINPDLLLEDFRVLDRGAPIVGPDLVVEGGNGRTMALIRAASDFPQQYGEYKLRLIDRAREFGLDPAGIEDLEIPILVRVRLTEVDRVRFAAETNTPAGISTSAIEAASEDANNITVDMLRQLDVLEAEGLADSLRATRNSQFVRTFLSSLPSNEQAQLVDSGGLINQDGIRRLVLAVFISAFPGDGGVRLAELAFESIDLQIRNVVNALSQSLGPLATAEALVMAGERQEDFAIAGDLATAVTIFARIKSTPGQTVEMFLNQSQLFGRELTPFQEELLQFLDTRSRSARRIASAIVNYADLVIGSPPPAQATLIPGAELTKEGLWQSAVADADIGMAAQDPRDAIDWCNTFPIAIDDVWSWRPLRELLITAVGAGAIVEVCEIGFTGHQVQVTIDTRLVMTTDQQPSGILRAAERLGGFADRILVQDPGVLLWTVKLPNPDETDLELMVQVPERSKPKPEPAEQPALFQGKKARMGQDSFISRLGGGTAFGAGFSIGGELAKAVVSNMTSAGKGKAAQPCGELTPQALKLDISGSGDFVRERVEDPDRFAARSFRTLVQDGHRLIVGCPVGSFDPERPQDAQCVDGLELQSVLHPRRCVVELVANAEELGIPIVDDGIADEIEEALQKAGLSDNTRNGANDMADRDGADSTAKQRQQIVVIR